MTRQGGDELQPDELAALARLDLTPWPLPATGLVSREMGDERARELEGQRIAERLLACGLVRRKWADGSQAARCPRGWV